MENDYTANNPCTLRIFGRGPARGLARIAEASDCPASEYPAALLDDDGRVDADAWAASLWVARGERGAVEDDLDSDPAVVSHYPI